MNKNDIDKLAGLARIAVSEEEKERLTSDLTKILAYVDQIKDVAVNISDSPDSELRNVMRKDKNPHDSGVYKDDIVSAMPQSEEGYLKVEKIL
jgi:aspartyl-tRNA(Asn)/glutamyl-tRNA(Gln) amidotransferase subunit C